MKNNKELLWLAFIFLLMPGCASIMQGSTQQVSVTSVPPGATLIVDGFQRLKTPAVLELSRKEPHRLEFSLEGYHPEVIDLRSVSSNMVAGNIIAGGLIGFAVDHSTGAAFRLVPEIVQVSLRPIPSEPVTVPAASVSREDQPTTQQEN
jgi:hypothetical protein